MQRLPIPAWSRWALALILFGALFGLSCVLASTPAMASEPQPPSFELDVMPILTAAGCNSGPCHGKARGQNGFQLSLLGFDPDFDYAMITQQARGRRIFPAVPEHSLLLRKGTAELPHGGGVRVGPGSEEYQLLRAWIAAGSPRRIENEPRLESLRISVTELSLAPHATHPLQVVALYSDGSQRNVTSRSQFQSNETGIVGVDRQGLITAGPLPGEAAVMVRYMNLIETCLVSIPLPGEVPDSYYDQLPVKNFVDQLVWNKLRTLGITPSPPADDATFLRRAHLDIIGRLPTPEEVQSFLRDSSANKRDRVVDELLERPEYADHWANKWMDLLRPNPYRVGIKAVFNYDNWIRQQFRRNRPYDDFVRDLLTAQGSTFRQGAVTLFRDRREPDELTSMISQLFLGIRLECAKCHHHPFEKWGQDDYYQFAAFFSRLDRKGTGLSPPISGSEEMFFSADKTVRNVTHPLTGETLTPTPLFGQLSGDLASDDPRQLLADWMTSPDNPYFAQVMANRVWADLMGRGLVEPVDDLRATNPPSNAPLLEALGTAFRDAEFDLKSLIRTIATSHVYGLSSLPGDRNVADTRNFSRHYRVRLRAEVLLDAVADVTGTPHDLAAMPPESRANQIWTHRVGSVFLDTFGRPDENQDPPCERTTESTVTQTLHLMNSPELHQRVTASDGRAARLAESDATPDEIIDRLYLLTYNRHPEPDEYVIARELFTEGDGNRRQATEDLLWALLNTPEFLFKN